ncbi:MAG: tRNA-dihydrouridine synthase, partial [Gammaproteobacteria bacterium]|nr:tRNA-dihydrouridine synthase [Gammaproteobacteria bacterium]
AAMHDFYGEETGVRVARKHLGWYSHGRPGGEAFRQRVNRADTAAGQCALTAEFLADSGAGTRQAA